MIPIPTILQEIASFGGSLYKKGPPPITVLQVSIGLLRKEHLPSVIGKHIASCACVNFKSDSVSSVPTLSGKISQYPGNLVKHYIVFG